MALDLSALLHTFNINLAEPSLTPEGFGLLTMLVDQDQGTGNDLGAATPRYVELTTLAAAQALQTAGYITAEVLALITPVFNNSMPRSSRGIRLVRVDTAAGTPETYSDAYTIYAGLGLSNVWAILMDSRTPATQVALAATVEAAGEHVLFVQDNDGDWLTSGVPSAFSATTSYERFVHIYHDTDTEPLDVAWVAASTAWDVDVASVGWDRIVYGVAAYATDPTTAEGTFALANNTNLIGAYGSSNFVVKKGMNIKGQQIKALLTRDVFRARLNEDVQNFVLDRTQRGLTVPANSVGADMLVALAEARLERMQRVGHFDTFSTPSASVTGSAATLTGSANCAGHVVSYTFNFDLTTN